jgi:hypothetical protein
MKKMAATHHLFLRKGVWYYRRRVPTHLAGVFKKRFIQCSLGTPHKKKAIQKRELLDVEWAQKFGEAKIAENKKIKLFGSAPDTPGDGSGEPSPLTEPLAVRLVQDYVERQDRSNRSRSLADPLTREDDLAEIRNDLLEELYIARERAANYDSEAYLAQTREEILKPTLARIDEKTFPAAELHGLVKRAAIELAQRAIARFDDDHSHPFYDDLFNPDRPAPMTVGELVREFLRTRRKRELPARSQEKISTSSAAMRC